MGKTLRIKQNDTKQVIYDYIQIWNPSTKVWDPVDLTGATVVMVVQQSPVLRKAAIVPPNNPTTNPDDNRVEVQNGIDLSGTAGEYWFEWEITFSGGGVLSLPPGDYHKLVVTADLG